MRFLLSMGVGVGLVGLAGCDTATVSEPGPEPGYDMPMFEAGSRLQVRVLDGGAGAEVFFAFYDTELETTCRFIEAVDGSLRCLPDTDVVDEAVFTDAACTEPAVTSSACQPAGLRTRFDFDTCTGYRAAEVFQPAGPPTATAHYGSTATGCWEAASSPAAEVSPASRLALDAFVLGTVENVPVAGDLGVQRIVGDDGSSIAVALLRKGHWCWPTSIDGELRCVDAVAASTRPSGETRFAADASCTATAAFYGVAGCGDLTDVVGPIQSPIKPGLAIDASAGPDGCIATRLFELGEDLSSVWADEGGGCLPYATGDTTFAAVGAELQPSSVPSVESLRIGSGRLAALAFGHAGAPVIGPPTAAFFDNDMGIECRPTAVVGGELRCLPESTYTIYFSDAACTEPLFWAPTTGCAETAPPRFVHRLRTGACADEVEVVLERGGPYDGPAYRYEDSGPEPGCKPAGTDIEDLFLADVTHPVTDFALVANVP